MTCGGCIRHGMRLVWTSRGFCAVPCTPRTPGPTPPEITVSADTSDPDGMTVQLTVISSSGSSPVLVDWGDGSEPEEVAPGQTVPHPYASPGTYTITVTSVNEPSAVTVPFVRTWTWADVKSHYSTWGDVKDDNATWADLLTPAL